MIRKFKPVMERAAVLSLIATYLFFPVALAFGNVFMGLALLCALLCGRYAERWRLVRNEPIVWAALILYALVLVGALHSSAPASDINLHLGKYAKLLAIPVFLSLLVEERHRRYCLNAFIVAMVFVLLSTYANIWWDLPWSKTHNHGWGVDHTVIGDYITQSVMMSFLVLVALSRGLTETSTTRRLLWWLVALLGAVSVSQLSSGRTGYLLLSLGLVTFAFANFTGRRRWMIMLGLALVLAFLFGTSSEVLHRVSVGLKEAQQANEMQITSIGGRVNFWIRTLDMTLERPWIGWGTGSYHEEWCARVTQPRWCWLGGWHPHNQYLFFWMETGVLGLLAFLALLGAIFWAALSGPRSSRPLLLAFGVMFAADSFVNAALWSSRESHFFVMMMVLLYAGAMFQRQPGAVSPRFTGLFR